MIQGFKLSPILKSRYFWISLSLGIIICIFTINHINEQFIFFSGYIYLSLIFIAAWRLGLTGALVMIIISIVAFGLEVNAYTNEILRRFTLLSMPFRFLAYLLIGITVGSLSEQHKKKEKQLQQLAHYDELTGCLNFRWLMDSLQQELAYALRLNRQVVVAMIDLDYFKEINDSYGHLAGNDILRQVVDFFKRNLRAHDIIGRYGGDEFLIIMREIKPGQAYIVMERLRRILNRMNFVVQVNNKTRKIKLSFSCGIAVFPRNAPNIKELLRVVDEALYQAKRKGRNRVVVEQRYGIRIFPPQGTRIHLYNSQRTVIDASPKLINVSAQGMLVKAKTDKLPNNLLTGIILPENQEEVLVEAKLVRAIKDENGEYKFGLFIPNMPSKLKEAFFL